MKFGPNNADEALIFAHEELRADVQYQILKALKQSGMSQAELAKKIGVSSAWISQILSDDANLTLETVSKIFYALGLQCRFSTGALEPHFAQVVVPQTTEPDGWKLTSTAVEHVRVVETRAVEVRSADTTALLMRVIEKSCVRSRPIFTGNDNIAALTDRMTEVA